MLTPFSYRLFFEFAKIVKYLSAKCNLFVLYRCSDFAFEEFAQLVLQFGSGEFRCRVPEVLHQHTVALVFLKQHDACLVVFSVGEPL